MTKTCGRLVIACVAAGLVFTGGCAANAYSQRQTAGAVIGATAGGLLGAQFGGRDRHGRDSSGRLVSTAIGVFVGTLVGSEIGRSMDEVDRMKANEANTRAQTAGMGERISWNNPRTHNSGSITPTREGYSESGNYCREFYQTVQIGGKIEDAYGVACRQPDGTWRIQG